MKKLIFSLVSLVMFSFVTQAQINGTITGTVVDGNQQPLPGVAVFYYGAHLINDPQNNPNFDIRDYIYHTYTDAWGNYSFNFNNMTSSDSIVIGVLDNFSKLNYTYNYVNSSSIVSPTIPIQFWPSGCQVLVSLSDTIFLQGPAGPVTYVFKGIALRDSSYSGGITVSHNWMYNNISRSGALWQGPNQDTIWITSTTVPTNVCYSKSANCSFNCYSPKVSGKPCSASFYVDTINSINFQGQVVIWDASSTDSGSVMFGYHWEFGDGNNSNFQYPTHTYNDTDIYNICLTIYTTDGVDTCISTFCDSVGFDSNGNLVHKTAQQGFTINVIDPATIGQVEDVLKDKITLYPNPSSDYAVINWDYSININQIDVVAVNGAVVRSIENPTGTNIKFEALKPGVYIVHLQTNQGATAVRMIVQ